MEVSVSDDRSLAQKRWDWWVENEYTKLGGVDQLRVILFFTLLTVALVTSDLRRRPHL